MILRKPYALLIKNFKKIHLVLCALMIFIAYQTSNIFSFFNEYIVTGTFTRTTFSLSSTYINIYMFIASLLIAIIALVIYILMRQKKKPKLLYFIMICFYLALIIFFFQIYGNLETLEISSISPRDLRVIRDIISIVYYSQYILIIVIGIRAVGFNIKKFNFGEDLAELEIDVSDNEEFELTVGIDPNKIGRTLRKSKRELKYFIVENLFVLSLMSAIAVITIGTIIFLNIEVYNKVYSQGEAFKAGYFVNQVNNAYYTHLNQRGVSVTSTGKVFIVTDVSFTNNDMYSSTLNLDEINLVSGKHIYSPIISRYQSFLDLGNGYINQTIAPKSTAKYILVFEVDDNIDFNALFFRDRVSLKISSTRLEAKYKRVKLNITKVDTIKQMKTVSLNDSLSLSSSSLKNTTLKVKSIEFNNQFSYETAICISNNCTATTNILTLDYTTVQKTLMRLSFDYSKDTTVNLSNISTLDSLINTYGFIRYEYRNKTYTADLIDKTPVNYTGKDLFYQVSENLKTASSIELVIRIRDKEYIYILK